jgi:hypothetical protein
MSAHNIPLDLVVGGDLRLRWSMRLAACLAAVAIIGSDGTIPARALLGAGALFTWLWLELRGTGRGLFRITLHPGGRCRVDDEDLRIDSRAWVSPWYAVLTCSGAAGTRSLLVSAGQQDPGEYRKLLCWARFGRWDTPARHT